MTITRWRVPALACLALCSLAGLLARGDDATANYELRYKFAPSETVRWRVEHRSTIRTTIQGTTKTAESYTESVKVWRVTGVDGDGNATFEHLVERVKMRQKNSGAQEVAWDSATDAEAPPVFASAASSVGVVLTEIQLSPQGQVLDRNDQQVGASDPDRPMTVRLPAQAVAVGESWMEPRDVKLAVEGQVHTVKTRQRCTLESVADGVATIKVETQILTPVQNPAVEAQLIQHKTNGFVRFDITAGRIVSQQFDLDEGVVGFNGDQSSLHCRIRFTEELLTAAEVAAEEEAARNR
jgi:hypothetical protein